ncbi:MAG: hypothetical protein E4H36_12185 [Spirochaetales bacterium]|nr:MAG: hypothetical protein E4H36_12185 [Spirochaetales bacterium]
MKKLLIPFMMSVFSLSLSAQPIDSLFDQPDSIFVRDYDDTYTVERDLCFRIASETGVGLAAFTAVELNRTGFFLYEKKDYENAVILFRNALLSDPSYVYPHYNLACTLALMNAKGKPADIRQIVYHLHKSVELDVQRLAKSRTDTDLDSVRNHPLFKAYLLLQVNNARFEVKNDVLFLAAGGASYRVAALSKAADYYMPVDLSPTWSVSPDGKYCAFFAEGRNGFDVYLLSHHGIVKQVTATGGIGWESSYYDTGISWSPDSSGFVFVEGSALWYFRHSGGAYAAGLQPLTDPEDWGSIIQPVFISADTVRFMKGNIFEYSFAGSEYEVTMTGGKPAYDGMVPWSGLSEVPGGRIIKGEDLRGGDGGY